MDEVKNSIEFFKHFNAQCILVESDSPKGRKEIWKNCTVLNISKRMKELEIFIKENCDLSSTIHLRIFFSKEWILPLNVEGKIQEVEKWRDGYVASVELTKIIDLDKFTNRVHFSENIDEELKKLIEERERLISIGGDKYIRKYVKKFGRTKGDSDSLGKLKELLKMKGVDLNEGEVHYFLNAEINEQIDATKMREYENFKIIISSQNPQGLRDYMKIFINQYGSNYQIYLDLLVKLLTEMNIKYDNLETLLEETKRVVELEKFETMLFSTSEDIAIERIYSMDGFKFEDFLANLFCKLGYTIEKTGYSNDQGADLIIIKLGERIAVQAKRYKEQVGNKAIQEVVASLKYYNCDKGMVVTTSAFTSSAIELAKANNIELVDGEKLESLIRSTL